LAERDAALAAPARLAASLGWVEILIDLGEILAPGRHSALRGLLLRQSHELQHPTFGHGFAPLNNSPPLRDGSSQAKRKYGR
jgi:hypothetical protein